jgi:hypothetical protein
MKTIPMVRYKLFLLLLPLLAACQRNTYPCPDIRGGTEVVKPGSTDDLKKPDVDFDSNGRLTKKPYSHSGMKKKKN